MARRDGSRRPAARARAPRMIRLGRIAYANMAPVFFRVDAEYEEVVGVPTELNRLRRRGRDRHRADLVDRVRAPRRHAAAAAAPVRLVRGRRRLDPARLLAAARPHPHRRGHARVGDLRRADEGAAARRRARPARRGGRRDAADRRRGAEVGVRGSDAAPRSRPALARAHRPADGVRRLGRARAGASRT